MTEDKINIAELLKDCPNGMELDCTICNGVKFIEHDRNPNFPIVVRTNNGYEFSLTKYGQVHNINDATCVIFPKGKTTWEGFQRPFEDGDIVATNDGSWIGIVVGGYENELIPTYCVIKDNGKFEAYFNKKVTWAFDRLATEEEKQKLFNAIKENGYKWNAETKTLEKLTELRFRVGDRVTNGKISTTIGYLLDNEYYDEIGRNISNMLSIKNQDDWELVPNKFDITTLKPFDKVLVRDTNRQVWTADLFSHIMSNTNPNLRTTFVCAGHYPEQCIPFEGNEHLLSTTDDCDEFYKTWK